MDETIQIPGYSIERNLGSGAMATVYLAEQRLLARKVALKLMAASLVADENFRKRFLREGQAVAQLNHPNIVTIYDIGIYESSYYMAMEYVDGGATLKEKIQEGLTPEQAVTILCQIGAALGYAHRHGLVHRDVKPANILFRADGTSVLSDFGIVRKLEDDGTQLTQQGYAVGTPAYMSPEQILGKQVDARSDLYSLGTVFHEMLTGQKPFQAEETFALALKHVNEPVPRLPQTLSRFQEIVDRLMAKEPDQRYKDADEMIQAIHKVNQPDYKPVAAGVEPTQILNGNDSTIIVGAAADATLSTPSQQRILWPIWLMVIVTAIAVTGVVVYWTLIPASNSPASCESPELTQEQQKSLEELLIPADGHYEFGGIDRWAGQDGADAASLYQRIITEIDPCHKKANERLDNIAHHFLKEAEEGLSKNENAEDIKRVIELGLMARPKHSALQKLKQQIEQN
jgi:serine/threonine protein kinase